MVIDFLHCNHCERMFQFGKKTASRLQGRFFLYMPPDNYEMPKGPNQVTVYFFTLWQKLKPFLLVTDGIVSHHQQTVCQKNSKTKKCQHTIFLLLDKSDILLDKNYNTELKYKIYDVCFLWVCFLSYFDNLYKLVNIPMFCAKCFHFVVDVAVLSRFVE